MCNNCVMCTLNHACCYAVPHVRGPWRCPPPPAVTSLSLQAPCTRCCTVSSRWPSSWGRSCTTPCSPWRCTPWAASSSSCLGRCSSCQCSCSCESLTHAVLHGSCLSGVWSRKGGKHSRCKCPQQVHRLNVFIMKSTYTELIWVKRSGVCLRACLLTRAYVCVCVCARALSVHVRARVCVRMCVWFSMFRAVVNYCP